MPPQIGLIGCGRWGRLILRDLVSLGAAVHVLARSEATLGAARTGGAASISTSLAGLGAMHGYVVATPTVTHAEWIERLLPTDRPVFIEKPMTADLASARRLVATAGERLFVMDKWRYHPGIEAMRAEIAAGRVGDVIAIQTTRLGWGNPHNDVRPLWILAPHDLSIALHLTGSLPHVRRVEPMSPRDVSLGFTAFLDEAGQPSVELSIGIASPEYVRRCLVVGSRATLELRGGYEQQIFVRRGAPGALSAEPGQIDVGDRMPLLAELECFLGYLGGGPPPMSGAGDGLLIVERLAEIEAALSGGGTGR